MSSRKVLEKIKELEKLLTKLRIELIKNQHKKSNKIVVGEEVIILNLSKGQEKNGIFSKVNYITGHAIIDTMKGKVSRTFKNLKRK